MISSIGKTSVIIINNNNKQKQKRKERKAPTQRYSYQQSSISRREVLKIPTTEIGDRRIIPYVKREREI